MVLVLWKSELVLISASCYNAGSVPRVRICSITETGTGIVYEIETEIEKHLVIVPELYLILELVLVLVLLEPELKLELPMERLMKWHCNCIRAENTDCYTVLTMLSRCSLDHAWLRHFKICFWHKKCATSINQQDEIKRHRTRSKSALTHLRAHTLTCLMS